jgi:hypothetical protein
MEKFLEQNQFSKGIVMYKYQPPHPILINLCDQKGFELRQKAANYLLKNQNIRGAERGSAVEQGFGVLAEIVLRDQLSMPEISEDDRPIAYDILLPSGVKVDIKCRGGELPFQEEYTSGDGIIREAKHNFFARQIYDSKLNTDIYLMTHLETPNNRTLPGTSRQRKWKIYICGWVSKKRVVREGVYLPRGSLTEQGRTWFTYRGQEIEFYNRNLKGLKELNDLLDIENKDVKEDELHKGDLNLTSVDAIRITYDLIGRGILGQNHLKFIKDKTKISQNIKPILHPNQYHHLLRWLKDEGQLKNQEIKKLRETLPEEPFTGI